MEDALGEVDVVARLAPGGRPRRDPREREEAPEVAGVVHAAAVAVERGLDLLVPVAVEQVEEQRPRVEAEHRGLVAVVLDAAVPLRDAHGEHRDRDRLDATRLVLRINALSAALDDLPRQARRLARWRANRARDKSGDAEAAFLTPTTWGRGPSRNEGVRGPAPTSQNKAARRVRRISPLRPGRPPGFSRRLDDDMRDLLTDLHGLAFDVLEQPDTS